MKVVGFVGSPRKEGNTDILVSEALNGAEKAGAEVQKVFLNDLDISPCQACESCLKTGSCCTDDDMQPLYDVIVQADAVIIGTPVYWWGPSAQTKVFFDRWYAFLGENSPKMKGKRAGVICVHGDEKPDTARHIIGMFEDAFSYLEMPFEEKLAVAAEGLGSVKNNAEALRKARDLGRRLAGRS